MLYLRQCERERPYGHGDHLFVGLLVCFTIRFKPHGVGNHGQKEQGHAAGDTLNPGEGAAGRSAKHGQPEMVTGQLLADRGGE